MNKKVRQKQIFLGSLYLAAIAIFAYLVMVKGEKLPLEIIPVAIVLLIFNYYDLNFPYRDFKLAQPVILAAMHVVNLSTVSVLAILSSFEQEDFDEKIPVYSLVGKVSVNLLSALAAGIFLVQLTKALPSGNLEVVSRAISILITGFFYYLVYHILNFLKTFVFDNVKLENYFSASNFRELIKGYLMLITLGFIAWFTYVRAEYQGLVFLFAGFYFYREAVIEQKILNDEFVPNLRALINQVESKAFSYGNHSQRIALIAQKIGQRIGLSAKDLKTLDKAALMHDIGMLGELRKYISKTERLTYEEYKSIQDHPAIAAGLLKKYEFDKEVQTIVMYQHEHYDGTGYPQGLIGDSIPPMARIISLAAAFCSMTQPRPFRKKRTYEEAKEEIRMYAGTQFDPDLADIMVYLIEEGEV